MEEKKYFKVEFKQNLGDCYRIDKSIIGIKFDGKKIMIKKLAGKNLPAESVKELIQELPEEWVIEGLRRLENIKHNWTVTYKGEYSRNYHFYVSADQDFPEFLDTWNIIHVSSESKLQEKWCGNIEEFVAIAKEIIDDYCNDEYTPTEHETIEVKEISLYDYQLNKEVIKENIKEIFNTFGYEKEETEGEKAERKYKEYCEQVKEEEE
ncbi:MAG: hypothetical protein PWQ83_1088 [Thermosipho sp. (in: thermotogales)]|nr:hypothetical protein [Thermosipho sp. (in: thermotogales)]